MKTIDLNATTLGDASLLFEGDIFDALERRRVAASVLHNGCEAAILISFVLALRSVEYAVRRRIPSSSPNSLTLDELIDSYITYVIRPRVDRATLLAKLISEAEGEA